MACYMLKLSNELHVQIFESLNDLDDARDLGRSCRHFSQLHVTHKRKIAQSIILSSEVYAYDICLSAFNAATSELATKYCIYDEQYWEPSIRPNEDIYVQCRNLPRSPSSLNDQLFNDICSRWQKTRILRDTHLDRQRLYPEYARFRRKLAKLGEDQRSYMISKPGFPIVFKYPERVQVAAEGYDEAYIERFHKALCLNSLGTRARSLALATTTDHGVTPLIGNEDHQYWPFPSCSMIIGGKEIVQSLQDKVDRLEVFDLIYHFALGKLLPEDKLNQWLEDCSETWMFKGYFPRDELTSNASRCELTACLRYCLSPEDIGDLITHLAWGQESNYPMNIEEYLGVRGAFDPGEYESNMDYHSGYERRHIIDDLDLHELLEEDDPGERCWWDRFRATSRSPFEKEFDWEDLMGNVEGF